MRTTSPLISENDAARFILELMKKCDQHGRKDFRMSANQIGRCRGDWFEYGIKEVLNKFLRPDQFRAYPGRGHSVREICGFEKVTWIPMPDIIVKSPQELRAVVSLKWGMRHDRMYEVGYEAYATKDWIQQNKMKSIKVLLVTANVFSGYESRLQTMHSCPVIDDIYFVHENLLTPDLKKIVKPLANLVSDLRKIAS
jgi:hypothetical protein